MAIYTTFDELLDTDNINEIKHQAKKLLDYSNYMEQYLIEKIGRENYLELVSDFPAYVFAQETAKGVNL